MRPIQVPDSSDRHRLKCESYNPATPRRIAASVTIGNPDHASRYLWTCEALSSTREDDAFTVFERLFKDRGLPANIRSDNGVPFASAQKCYLCSRYVTYVSGLNPEISGAPKGTIFELF
jgi:hypothetical protein